MDTPIPFHKTLVDETAISTISASNTVNMCKYIYMYIYMYTALSQLISRGIFNSLPGRIVILSRRTVSKIQSWGFHIGFPESSILAPKVVFFPELEVADCCLNHVLDYHVFLEECYRFQCISW